jgi:hypothetical protein
MQTQQNQFHDKRRLSPPREISDNTKSILKKIERTIHIKEIGIILPQTYIPLQHHCQIFATPSACRQKPGDNQARGQNRDNVDNDDECPAKADTFGIDL